jgi:dolichol-phosphate mannosyltransferase
MSISNYLVIIPTYNEKENIGQMIEHIFSLSLPLDILIVDDNSPDETSTIISTYQKTHKESLFLLKRPSKQGLGTAYTDGFKWAVERNYSSIITMDCDFSNDPNDLKRFIDIFNKDESIDLIIGSRYIGGIRILNWPLNRLLLSKAASIYVKFWLRTPVTDPTSGFAGYRINLIKKYLDTCKIRYNGYVFQILMKQFFFKNNAKIHEVPIIFSEREMGYSKISYSIIWEAFFAILSMKWIL